MVGPPDPATTEWVPIWNPISEGPVGPIGPQGPVGPIGPQGIQGIQGNQGNQGIQGIQGFPGEVWFTGSGAPAGSLPVAIIGDWYLDSVNGDYYEKTATTTWTLRGNLRGPQGIQGVQGPQGIQGVKGDTGPSGATVSHHATHEPGGADYLVNSAWLNVANVFTANQTIDKVRPEFILHTPGDIVKHRLAAVVPGPRIDFSTNMYFDGTNWMRDDVAKGSSLLVLSDQEIGLYDVAAGANPIGANIKQRIYILPNNGPISMYSSEVSLTGRLNLPALNPAITFGGTTSAFPGLRNTGTVLEAVLADGSNYASLRAATLHSILPGTSLVDLTVTGPVNLAGSVLSIAGQIDVTGGAGTIYTTAPIEIVMASHPRVAFHWPGVTAAQIGMDAAGNVRTYDNPGTWYAPFLCTVLNAYGTIYSSSYIQNVGVYYPGRIDIAPAVQGSFYWGSHGSYGPYTNSGIYAVGAIYGQVYLNHGGYYGFVPSHALTYDIPNALDDYEEGDWTPTVEFDSGVATYTKQIGLYTKIGRVVFISGTVTLSSIGTGKGRVVGLPFVPDYRVIVPHYLPDLAVSEPTHFEFFYQAPT